MRLLAKSSRARRKLLALKSADWVVGFRSWRRAGDAAGPDVNVLGMSERRGTDPRIPLREAFSNQLFRAPLGWTSSRRAWARRQFGPHETLAQLSPQPLQRVLEIQCV